MKKISDPENSPVIKDMTHEALHDLGHFDRKIFRTIPVLLFKPGLLTERTLKEQPSRYVRPLPCMSLSTFFFFWLNPKAYLTIR
jgi:hypothetical protein